MQADDVAGAQQVVELSKLDAELARLRLVEVGVGNDDVEVEWAQQRDDAAADPRGAHDADGASVVTDVGELAAQVRRHPLLTIPARDHVCRLAGEQNHRQCELGHRQRVGLSRGGDNDSALPARRRDVVFDRARRVDHGTHTRCGGQRGLIYGRAAPAREQHLGPGQCCSRSRRAELTQREVRIDHRNGAQTVADLSDEQARGKIRRHG